MHIEVKKDAKKPRITMKVDVFENIFIVPSDSFNGTTVHDDNHTEEHKINCYEDQVIKIRNIVSVSFLYRR
jgi:hypothetical protein